jgi:S-adenosylmethionine hydrolase
MRSCVALLSDFGSRDIYVGVMKSVIASIHPQVSTIDLTHEIPPGDVRQAAFRLWQALPFLPPGAVLLAVVDPGVGSGRRAVAVECGDFACVGPDNGIFTFVLEGRRDARAVEITHLKARGRSSTFHGRDIFAPAAGLLASGVDAASLGPAVAHPLAIPWPRLSFSEKSLRGEALYADRFGNMVTSVGVLSRDGDTLRLEPWVPGCAPLELPASRLRIRAGAGPELPLVHTFAEVPKGAALAYIGSDRLLEIGVNLGSAADTLKLSSGMDITISWS